MLGLKRKPSERGYTAQIETSQRKDRLHNSWSLFLKTTNLQMDADSRRLLAIPLVAPLVASLVAQKQAGRVDHTS